MEPKIATKEENLQILLKNFIESRDDIIIAFLYSKEGLLITKYGEYEKENEEVFGALSSLVENLLNKISIEYKIGNYKSGSFETSDHRIIYLEAGSEATLLLVCNYDTNLNQMFPIAYLIVEKIAQILENTFDFRYNTLEIPDLNIHDSFSLNLNHFLVTKPDQLVNGVIQTHHIQEPEKVQKLFKLVILGSAAVGKTTLVNQFLKKENIVDYRPTLGISISTQQYFVQGFKEDVIKFLIFDLAGQEFFKRVRREYYKGANCAFVVYDVSRRETFDEALNFWFEDARKELGNIPFVLIGNKIDLKEKRQVLKEEGQKKAEELRSFFIETSALKNINVQDTFKIIGIGLFFNYFEDNQ
jgi:Rab family protein